MTKKLTIFALFLVAGCVPATPGADEPSPWTNVGNSSYVRQFRFPDGTRCVIMDGYQSGGIACDWPTAGVER